MNHAGFTSKMRKLMWCEIADTTTDIDNVIVTNKGGEAPHTLFYKKKAKYSEHLRTIGEVAITLDVSKLGVKNKLDPRGRACLLIGYAKDHAGDVYKFYNMSTGKIVVSRDVQWLDKMWAEFNNVKRTVPLQDYVGVDEDEYTENGDESSSDDDEESKTEENEIEEEQKEDQADPPPRLVRRRPSIDLEGNRNQDLALGRTRAETRAMQQTTLGRTRSETRAMQQVTSSPRAEQMDRGQLTKEEWLEERAMVTAVTSDPQEPKTFREAWDHDDPEQRMKWREAIRKEIRLMIEKGVWRFVKRKEISKSRRLVGSKWVFKIKRDGTSRARLVALGYSQVPGVDFSDNFAPVVNDVTFRIVLTRKLVEKLAALSIDVETAFLYGELEEEIYMTVPDGYAEVTEEEIDGAVYCCALLKSIYGLVQAARQFGKKFVSELKKLGFKASEADPCLLFRRDEKGICILIMYVDDMLSVGNRASLESLKESLAKIFNIKTEVDLADYLGCKFIISDDGERGWLGQPHITDGLEKKFGEKVKDTFFGKTPGTPGSVVVRPKDKEDCISEEEQQEFRSGVGTLLYLTKHSRPDICNVTRELSKVMDGAAKAHQKELYRVIKHVLMTKALGLKFDPKREEGIWSLKAYSDSDFASDKDTRISVSGYVILPWSTCGLEKQRNEKCGIVNNRSRIYFGFRSCEGIAVHHTSAGEHGR
ncbi:hypothetical protein ACA910_022734 [Epithemia clementina (nom. ined.)]